ncbi:MAG TPA: hypothetical protein VGE04_04815 [Chloroflexia bacterium]
MLIVTKSKGLSPGTPAPKSGQYRPSKGGRPSSGEVTSTKGKPLPPTPQKGMKYDLVDETKHTSK